jgi:hypothetical protein
MADHALGTICFKLFSSTDVTVKECLTKNNEMAARLLNCKNLINSYHYNRQWDKYKRISNDFELVSGHYNNSPALSSSHNVSRSFYKLIEIIYDVLGIDFLRSKSDAMTCAFLAEGPGGFIEAFIDLRKTIRREGVVDNLYGMTLQSQCKKIPRWRIGRDYIQLNPVNLLTGVDKTGNLYNLDNIEDLVNTIGANACDLVTGDGGFDFSSDYDSQEVASLKLIACELYACMRLQKVGGCSIIKMFDLWKPSTHAILDIVYKCYKEVYLFKPLTSRPANSEKYLVCVGYKGVAQEDIDLLRSFILDTKKDLYGEVRARHLLKSLCEINKTLTTRQMNSILKTIDLIQYPQNTAKNMKWQFECALRWFQKYNIKVSLEALKQNLKSMHCV